MPEIIEDPVLRQRFSFTRTTDADGNEVLHVETWVDPGGGVTPHIHPAMEERFEVLEGTCSFLSGRKWVSAGPGETVVVPAGTRILCTGGFDNSKDNPDNPDPSKTVQWGDQSFDEMFIGFMTVSEIQPAHVASSE